MSRVKNSKVTRARRRKVLKRAKGFFGSKHALYRTANEQVMRSLRYEYRDRKQRKRQFRKLWITRINAACQLNDLKYSRFINGLAIAGIAVNRKMLSELAVNDLKAFTELCEVAKKALKDGKVTIKGAVKEAENTVEKFAKIDVKNLGEQKVVESKKTVKNETKKVVKEEKAVEPKKEVKKVEKVEVKKEAKTPKKTKLSETELTKLTVAELKELAAKNNVKLASGLKKVEIIAELTK